MHPTMNLQPFEREGEGCGMHLQTTWERIRVAPCRSFAPQQDAKAARKEKCLSRHPFPWRHFWPLCPFAHESVPEMPNSLHLIEVLSCVAGSLDRRPSHPEDSTCALALGSRTRPGG